MKVIKLQNNNLQCIKLYSMIVQIARIILLLWIFCLPGQAVFSQSHSSRNNYTGDWETPASWSPTWTIPQTNISSHDITINGYITVNDSLKFSGTSGNLIINDTLVIKGNLLIDNNNDLIINDNGILIVRGTLSIHNHANIIANGYFIITGDIDKNGPFYEGSFTSNDNPVKVFIGGTNHPDELTHNEPDYPVLNCTAPTTTRYLNSTCSYGNLTDLINDPIYSFFQTTCTKINANSNSPVCTGNTINLTSSGGTGYSWSGPNGFTSSAQNPSIPNASTAMAGDYIVTVTAVTVCADKDTINVKVNALPLVNITSNSSSMCINDLRTLTGSPTGGTFTISNGPGTITGNVLSATGTGNINLVYNYTDVCANMATQSITVNKKPIAIAGPDQELKFVFETQMKAELSSSETGEWSLISGSGKISDIHSPTTRITELSIGENRFLWKVKNGNCEATAEVKIIVNDLFVPSVITPNGDGKNDYFKISKITGHVELIIFNRWGNEEYTNDNYLNDWDGRNDKGVELPHDTYFYVVKFENGRVKKGSVLIKRE
jgi:gliding motility-associated-like protein